MYMNTAFDNVCFKGSVVSQSARFVYLCLCKHADNTNQTCFPSLSRIAQIVGKSISTIKRAVRELCRYGAIKRAPRFRKDGGQTSNLYEIVECDFEKLVEIPDNTEEKKAKSIVKNIAEVELENQDTMINTDADDILYSVSGTKALNQCTNKEKDTIQKDNAAEQADPNSISQNEESKSLHIASENNSVNPINVINENVDEAEQIYINEKEEHEVHQDQLEMIVNPTLKNSKHTYSTKLDNKLIKTNSDYLNALSIKKPFKKVIKPITYIISACKSRFSIKLNWGEVTSDPPRTYPYN